MIIRTNQMQMFSEQSAASFEEQIISHIKEFFPEDYVVIGENAILDVIRDGIIKSAKYYIRSEQDVCRYIDLMIVYGDDFDVDPEFYWMAEILNQKSLKEEEKMDLIYENIANQTLPDEKT